MTTVSLKTAPELQRLVRAAFPSYKKHNAWISAFNGGFSLNSYWDGGSRDEYAIVDLTTMTRRALPTRTHPYYDVAARGIQGENELISVDARGNIELKVLPENYAIVAAGTFCGKQATAHVYLNPANMPRLLGN